MCTVTFLPVKDGVVLTSNRDEWATRSTALAPCVQESGDHVLLYPKDKDGGGSWIAVNGHGSAAVLLNGAFHPHTRSGPYRQSRGRILIELLKSASPLELLNADFLSGIEPFTIILYSGNRLYECRWDGTEKFVQELSATGPHIWSSVTLYDEAMTKQREDWFHQWQEKVSSPGLPEIMHFHRVAGAGNPERALLMKRASEVATVSITSIHLSGSVAEMIHQDIRFEQEYKAVLPLPSQQSIPARQTAGLKYQKIKRLWIKWRYWEFWPFDLLYLPVYVYWFWLSLKARSFFFFSAANPLIENAGFLLEKKKAIYDLLPQDFYPVTVFCKTGISQQELKELLAGHRLQFPVIAKPNIGQRGLQVKLIGSEKALEDYRVASRVDFLVQEFISYEKEAGIFYYRIPGQAAGHISGIAGKEFLTVTGDGYSTIEQLLMADKDPCCNCLC